MLTKISSDQFFFQGMRGRTKTFEKKRGKKQTTPEKSLRLFLVNFHKEYARQKKNLLLQKDGKNSASLAQIIIQEYKPKINVRKKDSDYESFTPKKLKADQFKKIVRKPVDLTEMCITPTASKENYNFVFRTKQDVKKIRYSRVNVRSVKSAPKSVKVIDDVSFDLTGWE
ncbi:hypothetical protein SteCoe_13649 [Stentor coeruleus]|uniref:Uncharacterized protein n=1 Tax=Stentor coeruleus TaxID=5963 RepID=A0A1R2C7X3_9CILI|nr:hypothetical protein SteCoe_13649 [Stentor coeruleus]